MKVVVVGTKKDRERVAKVIKDKYGGLAEENAALLKKLERSNDAWIRGREEIADLKTAVKVFQDDTTMRKAHIEHLEEQIAALTTGPIRLCVNYTDDFSSVEIGVCDENGDEMDREVIADAVLRIITKLTTENKHLRVRLRSYGDVETAKEEALRGEGEDADEQGR